MLLLSRAFPDEVDLTSTSKALNPLIWRNLQTAQTGRRRWPSQVALFPYVARGLQIASVRPSETLSRLSYLYPVIYF